MNNKINDIPETLDDHIFYGLTLDEDQRRFRDSIYDRNNIVTICNAKAGSGKTLIAVATGILLVNYGLYDGIVYIFAPTMEQKQGYIPGDTDDKNAPYRQPLDDALVTIGLNPDNVIKGDNMKAIKEGKAFIDFTAHTFLRGVNFENKVVIVDDMQNYYKDDCKKVLTRIHDTCKVVLIGHTGQCDILSHPERSGFAPYLSAFERIKDDPRVSVCQLNKNYRGWFSTFCDEVI